MVVCTMSIPISLSRLKEFKKYILVFNLIRTPDFNLLRFIAIDIVQTMMSVSTLYLFPFSSYMKKKTCFRFVRECSSVMPWSFLLVRLAYDGVDSERCLRLYRRIWYLHLVRILLSFIALWKLGDASKLQNKTLAHYRMVFLRRRHIMLLGMSSSST